jgi:hypothetical protein
MMEEVKGLRVSDVLGEPDVKDHRWGAVANLMVKLQDQYLISSDWRIRASKCEHLNGVEAACWMLSQGYLIDIESPDFFIDTWDKYMTWVSSVYAEKKKTQPFTEGFGKVNVTRR